MTRRHEYVSFFYKALGFVGISSMSGSLPIFVLPMSGVNFFQGVAMIVSAIVDLLSTGSIVFKLIANQKVCRQSKVYSNAYRNLIAIFAESLVLYTIPKLAMALWNVLTYFVPQPLSGDAPVSFNTLSEILPVTLISPLTCIAPAILLTRVVLGMDSTQFTGTIR